MSDIRIVMEEFVLGQLDFAGLERKLAQAKAAGATRRQAVESLEQIDPSGRVSAAVEALLRRAVERHFPMDDTDPFPEIRPSEERGGAADPETEAEGDVLPAIFAEDDADRPQVPAAVEDVSAAPAPGAVIAGRYELEQLVGQGGAGLVYRALDRCRGLADAEEPRVALKMVKPGLSHPEEAQRRLISEGLQGAELRHRNLVRVFDVGMDDGVSFVTMELLGGDSLRNTIVRKSPEGFPPEEGLRILEGIAGGLAFLHGKGLVHGDLKPGNVFLAGDGAPKLLDFGTAVPGLHGREPTLDGGTPPPRTPAYASPEVLAGDFPGFRDDVFSLGLVACELLSSRHPFGRVPADKAREERLRPALPSGLGARRRRALRAALSFDRRRRPRDAAAFLDAMGMGATQPGRTPVAAAALAGLAAGILLVLGIIDPGGPLVRLLGMGGDAPETSGPTDAAPTDVVDPAASADPLSPGPAVAGRSIPSILPPEDGSPPEETPAPPPLDRTPVESTLPSAVSSQPSIGPAPPPGQSAPSPAGEEPPSGVPAAARSETRLPAEAADAGPAQESAGADTADPPDRPAPTPPPDPPPVPSGPGSLSFSRDEIRVAEGDAVVVATIRRREGSDGEVTVRWRTAEETARGGADFIATDWTRIAIPDGETRVSLYVPLVDDGLAEGEETFVLELSDPGGGAVLGTPRRIRIRISDDERLR